MHSSCVNYTGRIGTSKVEFERLTWVLIILAFRQIRMLLHVVVFSLLIVIAAIWRVLEGYFLVKVGFFMLTIAIVDLFLHFVGEVRSQIQL